MPGRDAVEQDAGRAAARARGQPAAGIEEREHQLERERRSTTTLLTVPEPGPLPQRDPEQDHERADDADPRCRCRSRSGARGPGGTRPTGRCRGRQEDQRGADAVERRGRRRAAGGDGRAWVHRWRDWTWTCRGQSRDHGPMSTTVAPSSLADDARRGLAPAAAARRRRWPTRCGRSSSTAGSPCGRACRASARWRPQLGVSRGTVSRAYDRLREDGYLVSARGAGSWLTLPDGAGPAPPPSASGTAPRAGPDRSPRSPRPSRCSARPPRGRGARSAARARLTATPPRARPSCARRSRDRFAQRGVDDDARPDPRDRRRPAGAAPRARAARRARRPRARRRARLPAHAVGDPRRARPRGRGPARRAAAGT